MAPKLSSSRAKDGTTTDGRRSRVSGIDRALQILDHLHGRGEADGAYSIAKAIGAPLSTVYVIVDDLLEKNLLARTPDGSVWLGERLYHYGLAYARSLDLMKVARDEMHVLRTEAGETVQICGRDGDFMVVLDMADGPDHFQVASRIGTRVPLNWTASGRLLVAHLPEQERLDLFRRCTTASPTGKAETDPEALSRASVRAFGSRISIQAGESDFAVACIASPICDARGDCRATISIVLPATKAQRDSERYGALVRHAAQRIEERMGWRPLHAVLENDPMPVTDDP
ncbi:IclR family transcriptional regulator [Gluconacetobacter tumulisoli]|uniref:IclR family transcriptional regulator n=1 Tax=Gluconacetobacter tumulisoli TaxID=1286189 RepID=UPI001C81FEB7|nr:IclR family transcriptional regulator [Gluconacetobacter tumulisoli]